MSFDRTPEPCDEVFVEIAGIESNLNGLGLLLPQIVERNRLVGREPHAALVGGDAPVIKTARSFSRRAWNCSNALGNARTSIWPSRSSSWKDPHHAPFFDFRFLKSVTMPPTDTSVPAASSRSAAVRWEAKSSSKPLRLSRGWPLT
jgi:hypothetical protein